MSPRGGKSLIDDLDKLISSLLRPLLGENETDTRPENTLSKALLKDSYAVNRAPLTECRTRIDHNYDQVDFLLNFTRHLPDNRCISLTALAHAGRVDHSDIVLAELLYLGGAGRFAMAHLEQSLPSHHQIADSGHPTARNTNGHNSCI